MGNGKKFSIVLVFTCLILILGGLIWFIMGIFESDAPLLEIEPRPEFLAAAQELTITASDEQRGLRRLLVVLSQEGREIKILEETFSFVGLFNQEGQKRLKTSFKLDPAALGLAQGVVELQVSLWDYSRRGGGDGNRTTILHQMVVDTIPPALRTISTSHYINLGGAGLIVYETSADAVETGIFVNEHFFPGYPMKSNNGRTGNICYFTVPVDTRGRPEIRLWARDQAGNSAQTGFYFQVRHKSFRSDSLNISDAFISKIMPYFASLDFQPGTTLLDRFLKINRDLRVANNHTFYEMRTDTVPRQLWEGTWVRLKNAANMARFGDQRTYLYQGRKVDQQVHLGIDLASLANSPVQAANHGRVIFADSLGIYGNTVVLDHGQGLASTYSHLSRIDVGLGKEVTKGDTVGLTGMTGLAGGDHLHFGVMVSGVFVNPVEWWDIHWIRDNVQRKLELLQE